MKSELITKIKVATTIEPQADKIVSITEKLGISVHKGSINNVLERFYETAKPERPDWVVRLTSDCPLIDPLVIDEVILFATKNDLDYASNTLKPTFPDGMDVEVFKFSALETAVNEASLISEIEHVTPYIWKNSSFFGGDKFTSGCVTFNGDYSSFRLTVDTIEDFQVIETLIELLGTDKMWLEYVNALQEHPEILEINRKFSRNEGYVKSLENDKKS